MARTSLNRFADVGFLRRLNFELLLTFLLRFQGYLTAKRGLELSDNLLTFRYDQLVEILLTPDNETPMELIEGFYLIDELSKKPVLQPLYAMLEKAGTQPSEALPIEDLALFTLIEKPEILDYLHAEQYLVRPKKFETLFCRTDCQPTITEETITQIETRLNEWFSTERKGRGVKVYRFFRSDGIWFLVQHGKQIKCDFTHEDNGDSRRILYRPGTFDVLCFEQEHGEFKIHAGTKKEKTQYCRLFGKHLFNDENFFQSGDPTRKYTLDPLKAILKNTLVCYDVDGLKLVDLVEIQIAHGDEGNLREIYKTETSLTRYPELMRQRLTDTTNIVRASFRLTFTGDSKPRCVTICAPNVTIYDREADGSIVESWLKSRGFLLA